MSTTRDSYDTRRHPYDGPVAPRDKSQDTGLLTRWVPEKLKHGSFYRWVLRTTRVLQFLSSIISLGIFSSRLYKVYRLVNSLKTRRGVNGAYGAVEGILAAAVLYTLITTLLGCIKKSANPGGKTLRWIWVLLDVLFVGAFIAVSVLTRPNGGLAGVANCYNPQRLSGDNDSDVKGETAGRDDTCSLPWGTFMECRFLHAITAAFHEIRDQRREKNRVHREKAIQHQHENGTM